MATLREKLSHLHAAKVPKEWLTLEQLAKREGYQSTRGAMIIAREALAAGLIERKMFPRVTANGGLRATAHYRYVR